MSRYVIDQNYFRDPDLERRLVLATEDDEFVITDYALIEMFKSPHWELISRRSLENIAAHPERVVVCHAPSDVLRSELSTGDPTAGWHSLVDSILTVRVRAYLRELATVGQNGPRHAMVTSMISSAQAGIASQQQDHTANLQLLQNGVRILQRAIRGPALRDLRAGRMPDHTQALLAINLATDSARTLLLEQEIVGQDADDFLGGDSFLLRSQISFCLLTIDWVKRNGIDSFRPNHATNELIDIDYALFGSYCDGVLTREPTVTRHHALLMTAVSLIQSE